jgi:hypothetical protein
MKMHTSSGRICAALATLALVAMPAHAQNLVFNPTFDENIDDWWTSASIEWAPSFGYENGSMHLFSQTTVSSASQCVQAGEGSTYVASARVYSHCVGARFYVFWASDGVCSDTGAFPDYVFARSSATDEWELLTIVAPSSAGAHFADITLYNGGGCPDGVYFDDVMLELDEILNDGFEHGEAG